MADSDTKIVEMLSVLAEPTRIKILEVIAREGELCAKDILPVFAITQPTLSHHLNLLIDNDILSSRKDGRFVYYSINKKSMEQLKKLLDTFTEPPVVSSVKKSKTQVVKQKDKKPVLKKTSSVPSPKIVIASPDLEEIKRSKKKKKSDRKKKDKDKKKKK